VEVNLEEILDKLSLKALQEVCKIKNTQVKGRKKSEHVLELITCEWSEDELQRVIEILKNDQENSVKAVMSYLFRSSKIINLSPDSIKSKLDERKADLSKEDINGFKVTDSGSNLIECEYWYTQKNILVDDTGKLRSFRMPSRIRFMINPLDGIIMVSAINPGLALKCKKELEDILDMIAMPISPLVGGLNSKPSANTQKNKKTS
jgi:hypothetical protein